MNKDNIYTSQQWSMVTPYKGIKKKFFSPIKDLFSEEKGRRLVPQSDIESPNKVLRTLWPDFDVERVSPFKDIRTGANIWEYYLLRMFDCKKSRYEKLRKKPSLTYSGLRKIPVGFNYSAWKKRYPEINNEDLKKSSSGFIESLKEKRCALRFNDHDKDFIKKRQRAAKAFFKYLTSGIDVDSLKKCGGLYDILISLIKKTGKKRTNRMDHLCCIGLMLCLYGRKDECDVSADLAKCVCAKIDKIKNSLVDEICTVLRKETQNFTKNFKPPYSNIYGFYQDRAIILFRLTTWLTLVESTSKAREEG
ncbi:MAG: hypothetical protein MJY78_07330 [Fibrobacter sp.]|nr:hypothetical protein [Fibrobacter sp.]